MEMLLKATVLAILTSLYLSIVNASTEPFSFVVMADVHGFTPLAFQSDGYKSKKHWKTRLSILKNIYQNYGQSKFLITIGDSVSFGGIRDVEFVKKLGGNMSTYDAVYMAGVNAHNRTREMVLEAGFERLLPVVGDHELGGM